MNAALLVIDAQNDFFAADNPNLAAFEATVAVVNAAIAHFRAAAAPPLFIQHTSEGRPVGSQRWAIFDRFDCRPVDTRMNKTAQNAFWNTGLDALLRSPRVDRVVIAGFLRGAQERGYDAVLLEGGIASLDDRYTQFVLEISPRLSLDALKAGA